MTTGKYHPLDKSSILSLSKYGYFHNDLRPWNVIVNNEEIGLIDFEFLGINKKIMFLITLAVGLGGPLMESIIIHFTNQGSWKYGNPSFNWYVPLDLLPGYSLLGFGIIIGYFVMKRILVE